MKKFLIILEILIIVIDFCLLMGTNELYDIYTWCAGFLLLNAILGIPLFVIYSFFNFVLNCLDKLKKDDIDERVDKLLTKDCQTRAEHAQQSLDDLQKSLDFQNSVLKNETNNYAIARINNRIGDIYYQMGKFDEALEAYNTAIDIDKTFEIAIEKREKVLKILNKEKSQQEKFSSKFETQTYTKENKLEFSPDDNNKQVDKLEVTENDNQNSSLNKALDYYKEILKRDENNSITYNAIGNIYYQIKKFDKAFEAYDKAIESDKTLESAIENRKKVLKILDEETSKHLSAKSYFHNAENLLTKQKYEEAIENINKAISLDSSNEDYLKLLDVINEENNKHLARAFYQKSLKCLKDGDFDQSIINIKQALELYPNNKTYQKILSKANSRMIDIKTCTKNAILTLDGFDNEKAELFINERKTMTWYDLDSFAKYFDLQPHERVLLEDKLIFPKKPLIKKGRTLEY